MIQLLHYRKLPVLTLFFALLFMGGTAMGQKNWLGGAAGNWNVGTNWTGGTVPGTADDVVIGVNTVIQVDVSATINSLTISGTSVTLVANGGGPRIITIDNNGSSIATGSTLTLEGTFGSGTRSMNIAFLAGGTRTMTIDGTLVLTSTGEGTSYSATNSATTVNGTIRTTAGAGTVPVITSTIGNLTFASGGTYDHEIDAGTIPAATWNANSTLEFSGGATSAPAAIGSTTFGKVLVTNNTTANLSGTGGPTTLTFANGTGTDLTVNAGSTLAIASTIETTTLAAGATASIAGTYSNGSPTLTNFNAASVTVAASGTWAHNFNGGTTPTLTWTTGGTLAITGVTTTAPTLTAGFTNLVWNCVLQSADVPLNTSLTVPGNFTVSATGADQLVLTNGAASPTLNIGGDFIIQSGGEFDGANGAGNAIINVIGDLSVGAGSQFRGTNTAGTGDCVLDVDGDIVVSGGTFVGVSGNGDFTANVAGDFVQTGGTVDFKEDAGNAAMTIAGNFAKSGASTFNQRPANTAGTSAITVVGNFSHSGSGTYNFSSVAAVSALEVRGNFSLSGTSLLTETGGAPSAGNITFNGGGTVVYTGGAANTINTLNFVVSSGTTLQMNDATTVLDGSGTFTLESGATLGIRSAVGIAASAVAGNIQVTGTRFFNTGGRYLYNGAAAQTTGDGIPTALTGRLIIENAAGVTLSGPESIGAGGTVALLSGTFATGANLTLGTGAIISRGGGSITGTLFPITGNYEVIYTGGSKTAGPELEGGQGGANRLINVEVNLSAATNSVTLATTTQITGNLVLSLGTLTTSPTSLFRILAGGGSTGGSPFSFVNGPLEKQGTTAFVFPVGAGTVYRPVAISGSAASLGTGLPSSSTFRATLALANPYYLQFPPSLGGTLISLTNCYYWNVERSAGTGAVHVWGSTGSAGPGFTNDFLRACMTPPNPPTTPPNYQPTINNALLRVAHFTGGAWQDLGQGAQVQSTGAWFISALTGVSTFSPFTIGSAQGVLPVTLTSFTALKDGNSVKLNWETSSEQNSAYFDVERSADGVNYSSIGKVNAAGNSATLRKYSFTDNNPSTGRNFYRLRQVDLDAQFAYSKTISVNMAANAAVSIYPNPVQSSVVVEYPKMGKGATYKVLGVDGRVMQSGALQENSSQQNINLSNLQRGNYILVIEGDGQQYVQKIIKQ